MITGGCNCGAVRFRIETEISDIYACHCSVCRRWSGTNGVTVVITSKAAFKWIVGNDHIRRWQKPDADWQSAFCGTCGSALPVENDDARLAVPAGLFDDGAMPLRIAAHIWTGSKAQWDKIAGDAPKHPQAFGS